MISGERRYWNWQQTQDMPIQHREANALEYIAHYLDRIDQHLARNAETNDKIQASLNAIAHQFPKLFSGVNR